jgi:hypothetical protein
MREMGEVLQRKEWKREERDRVLKMNLQVENLRGNLKA